MLNNDAPQWLTPPQAPTRLPVPIIEAKKPPTHTQPPPLSVSDSPLQHLPHQESPPGLPLGHLSADIWLVVASHGPEVFFPLQGTNNTMRQVLAPLEPSMTLRRAIHSRGARDLCARVKAVCVMVEEFTNAQFTRRIGLLRALLDRLWPQADGQGAQALGLLLGTLACKLATIVNEARLELQQDGPHDNPTALARSRQWLARIPSIAETLAFMMGECLAKQSNSLVLLYTLKGDELTAVLDAHKNARSVVMQALSQAEGLKESFESGETSMREITTIRVPDGVDGLF